MIATTLPSDDARSPQAGFAEIPFLGWWPFPLLLLLRSRVPGPFCPLRLPLCWRLTNGFKLLYSGLLVKAAD